MRKIGTIVAIAALSAAAFSPTPGEAFGLRLGPLYIGIPYIGFQHRHHPMAGLHDDASLRSAETASGLTSPLLYPALALPVVYDQVFAPPSSVPWPFSYDAILQAAFAKTRLDRTASACPQLNRRSAIGEGIRNEVRPTGDQVQLLQRLDGALTMAGAYLAKTCPNDIPADPAARLQLMEWQVEKLAEALDIVRQPLADFQQSLDDTQRARFSTPVSDAAATVHPDHPDNIAPACAVMPTKVDASIEQISLSVQPTDVQQDTMNSLKQAFSNAANELDANCAAALPADPLARLESTEARLDVTWRALVSIQTALAGLESGLSGEQRARFDTVDFVASAQ